MLSYILYLRQHKYYNMIIVEVKRKTTASKEEIWRLWSDVKNWDKWDYDVVSSSIDGRFETGTTGVLKPKGGPKTKFKITEATENRSFSNRSLLPLCSIYFVHELNEVEGTIEISHRIEMKGLLSGFFSKVMGKNIARGLPGSVENLIKLVENGK